MTYAIEPYVGVTPVRFGMSPDEVRKALRATVEPVEKSGTGIPVDFFRTLGVLAYYKEPGTLEAVEFGGPGSPTLHGKEILGRPYSEIARWIRSLDPDASPTDAGLKSYKLGLSVFAPAARHAPEDPVKGVIVFEKGFYERHAS